MSKYDLTDYLNHQAWTNTKTLGKLKCELKGCLVCNENV